MEEQLLKSISKLMIFCLLLLVCGGLTSRAAQAAEAGGQVSNPSSITFFEGDNVLPDTSQEIPSTIDSPPKKLSLLPQTGERVEWLILAGGSVLSLVVIGWLVLRMRRLVHEK